jgi:hypothetical protein
MAKPLKFHQTLNLPPRSAKHGKHRRARPAVHGHTIIGADHGARGSDQGSVTFSGAIAYMSAAVPAAILSAISAKGGTLAVGDTVTYPGPADPPPIPNAGIRAGEIIGHRLWWVIPQDGEQWLCSLAHRRLWWPGETIEGNVTKPANEYENGLLICTIMGGVYAFATMERLGQEIRACLSFVEGMNRARRYGIFNSPRAFDPTAETSTLVSGTVKMWGDVVEHEKGYRAQFAKVASLDRMFGDGDLDALRARYLPGCYPPSRRCTCGAFIVMHRPGCPVGDAIV